MIPEEVAAQFQNTLLRFKHMTIALVEAQEIKTGAVHYLICETRESDDETSIYPLARLLLRDQGVDEYLPPESDGGYGYADAKVIG